MTNATAGVHRRARERGGVAGSARAQQRERMRRMGVLMGGDENDPDQKRALSLGLTIPETLLATAAQRKKKWTADRPT